VLSDLPPSDFDFCLSFLPLAEILFFVWCLSINCQAADSLRIEQPLTITPHACSQSSSFSARMDPFFFQKPIAVLVPKTVPFCFVKSVSRSSRFTSIVGTPRRHLVGFFTMPAHAKLCPVAIGLPQKVYGQRQMLLSSTKPLRDFLFEFGADKKAVIGPAPPIVFFPFYPFDRAICKS